MPDLSLLKSETLPRRVHVDMLASFEQLFAIPSHLERAIDEIRWVEIRLGGEGRWPSRLPGPGQRGERITLEGYSMGHLAKVVPIVGETEQLAWMTHASVVVVLPALTTQTGELEPKLEETEPPPVRIRWVRQSATSPTGGGSRETRLQQPSPFEAHRDPQPQPIPWAKLVHRPGEVAEKARNVGSQDQDITLQRSPGRFCKVREFPFQDQAPNHPGSCGGPLEWLHPFSVHASPRLKPVRNPRKIRDNSEAGTEQGVKLSRILARSHLTESGGQAIRGWLRMDPGRT
jgi:hypothetical protein